MKVNWVPDVYMSALQGCIPVESFLAKLRTPVVGVISVKMRQSLVTVQVAGLETLSQDPTKEPSLAVKPPFRGFTWKVAAWSIELTTLFEVNVEYPYTDSGPRYILLTDGIEELTRIANTTPFGYATVVEVDDGLALVVVRDDSLEVEDGLVMVEDLIVDALVLIVDLIGELVTGVGDFVVVGLDDLMSLIVVVVDAV